MDLCSGEQQFQDQIIYIIGGLFINCDGFLLIMVSSFTLCNLHALVVQRGSRGSGIKVAGFKVRQTPSYVSGVSRRRAWYWVTLAPVVYLSPLVSQAACTR